MTMTDLQRSVRDHWATGQARGLWMALFAAAWIAGCGVGTGGTGAFGSAPVDGFGSIFVGGIEFDDASAVVIDDDGAAVRRDGSELRLGMLADVDGATLVNGPNGPASLAATVRLTRAVVGPVAATDVGRRTLSVLGQSVVINGATAFDPALHGGLAALKAGDGVSVYGFATGSGQTVATRIEPAAVGEAWRLRGVVAGLDAGTKRFGVGAATLDYSGAANVPANLADGQLVHLRLNGASVGGALGVSAFGPLPTPPERSTDASVEGLTTASTKQGLFRIGSITVDSSAAMIDPASAALVAGVHARVKGRLEAGVLVADRIKLLTAQEADSRPYQVTGTVGGLSVSSFVARGVAVDASAATYVNGSASLLANGVKVRVQGVLSGDGTALRATQITFL
jgi:hypothetical protein